MPHRFLIATDLSDRADRALRRGFALAAETGAFVTVLSVVDDSLPEAVAEEVARKSRDHLHAVAKGAAAGRDYQIEVVAGDPVALLIEKLNAPDVDLAIVGRHRPRKIFDGLRRTTIESVVLQSTKPVLMVVNPADGAYRRVLVPVAFSSACLRAVRRAHLLAPGAEFRLYHAWSAPFEGITGGKLSDYAHAVERETAEEAKAWATLLPEGLPGIEMVHDGVVPSVYRQIEAFRPDLLAVGANTRSGSLFALGSFTSALLRDPPADLLITRAR